MPKSKRNKLVELTKTKKHGMEGKEKLFKEIQSCVESYANIYIFSVNDMRNSKIKSVRDQWRHSRFFIGKNKVMAIALGITPEKAFRPNLHKIGERLKGQCGLLFSNQPTDEVLKWFSSYSEGDYARSGNRATQTVVLREGPLEQFPHNIEPYLRHLGLPTTLNKGIVHLMQDHTVCNEDDILTPETAKILKLLGYEMAEFYIKIECVWSQDGSFKSLTSDSESNADTSSLDVKPLSSNIVSSTEISEDEEEMEVSISNGTENIENQNGFENMDDDKGEIAKLVSPKETKIKNIADDKEEVAELVEDVSSKETKIEDIADDEEDVAELVEDVSSKETKMKDSTDDEEEEIPELVEDISSKETKMKDATDDEEEEIPELVEDISPSDTKIEKTTNDDKEETSSEDETENIVDEEQKQTSLNEKDSSILVNNNIQSPVITEKKTKYSPRVTRSIAKQSTKKSQPLEKSKKLKDKSIVKSLEKEIVQSTIDEDVNDRGRARNRDNAKESPAERKLRNRSVKIAKKKQ